MVNHFASLLVNFNLSYLEAERDEYLLAGDNLDIPDFLLVTQGGDYLYISGATSQQETRRDYSALTNKDYSPMVLPEALENFHNILYPEKSSKYYKQFLLYSYLRLINATSLKDQVKVYDKRITYDLEEFSEYFRSPRLSPTNTNDLNFKLLVSGDMTTSDFTQAFSNHIIVSQIGQTGTISIYSITQGEYYTPGEPPSSRLAGMEIELSQYIDPLKPTITRPIALSDTGLSIILTGPFDRFSSTSGKAWAFSAEAPFIFDYNSKLALINNSDQKIDAMLNYAKNISNPVFENIWRGHYNSVYKLAGLLAAYVERMNFVWETRRT
jgi:hypothetical protein